MSRQIVDGLDAWRKGAERLAEETFHAIYGSPALQAALGIDTASSRPPRKAARSKLHAGAGRAPDRRAQGRDDPRRSRRSRGPGADLRRPRARRRGRARVCGDPRHPRDASARPPEDARRVQDARPGPVPHAHRRRGDRGARHSASAPRIDRGAPRGVRRAAAGARGAGCAARGGSRPAAGGRGALRPRVGADHAGAGASRASAPLPRGSVRRSGPPGSRRGPDAACRERVHEDGHQGGGRRRDDRRGRSAARRRVHGRRFAAQADRRDPEARRRRADGRLQRPGHAGQGGGQARGGGPGEAGDRLAYRSQSGRPEEDDGRGARDRAGAAGHAGREDPGRRLRPRRRPHRDRARDPGRGRQADHRGGWPALHPGEADPRRLRADCLPPRGLRGKSRLRSDGAQLQPDHGAGRGGRDRGSRAHPARGHDPAGRGEDAGRGGRLPAWAGRR